MYVVGYIDKVINIIKRIKIERSPDSPDTGVSWVSWVSWVRVSAYDLHGGFLGGWFGYGRIGLSDC